MRRLALDGAALGGQVAGMNAELRPVRVRYNDGVVAGTIELPTKADADGFIWLVTRQESWRPCGRFATCCDTGQSRRAGRAKAHVASSASSGLRASSRAASANSRRVCRCVT